MGSFSILNNISGVNAQNQLTSNNVNLSRTLLRLSSGKRISSSEVLFPNRISEAPAAR